MVTLYDKTNELAKLKDTSCQIIMSSRRNRGGSGGNSSSNGANSSSPSVRADLLDLSRHLRQERLFVNHEKSQLEQVRHS